MTVRLEDYIATIPNFPKEGILFRDVTPMVADGEAFHQMVDEIVEYAKSVGAEVIVGPESRGFLFGCPAAYAMKIGFVPVRKPGKLPRETVSCTYDLEYGSNELHMHKDAVKPGQRCVIIDDLLATGGTAEAAAKLVEMVGGVVAGFAFVVELEGLNGIARIEGYDVYRKMYLSDK